MAELADIDDLFIAPRELTLATPLPPEPAL
jgi:hypothetical protein